MKKYKPQTVEENLANIVFIKNDFCNIINGYLFDYKNLMETYNNVYIYNYKLMNGMINPFSNLQNEIIRFAYSVWGFTNDVFERISYALDCWKRLDNINSGGATDKNYDQVIRKMQKSNLINGKEVNDILNFRMQRNYGTHYGRIQFINYIFNNSNLIYNLLITIENMILQKGDINNQQYLYYMDRQLDFIGQVQLELEGYALSNNLCS